MILCPSMMCVDIQNLKKEVKSLEEAGADLFHCDVMDGHFVNNMALGLEDLKAIKNIATIPMDMHLMIDNPSSIIDLFIQIKPSIIYIHFESEKYISKTLNKIKESGIRAGLAINPDTSISSIEEVLYLCDDVLVMSVNPGFKGQNFINTVNHKITMLSGLKKKYGYRLFMDGACSMNIIKNYSQLGIDGFVLGTSTLFKEKKVNDYKDILRSIRGII